MHDDKSKVVVVATAVPDEQAATTISEALVSEGLAACVQAVAPCKSTYLWQGELRAHQEVLLHAKTTAGRSVAAMERIRALHPYELPELVVHEVAGGRHDYLEWVRKRCGG